MKTTDLRRQLFGFAMAGAFMSGLAAGWRWHAAGPFSGPPVRHGAPGPVDAGQFTVPAPVGNDGRLGYLMVTLTLDAPDQADADAIAANLPHVKDAVVEAILALSPGWFDGAELRTDRAESDLRLLINRNLGMARVSHAQLDTVRRLPRNAG
jgi:flagellar basal body-associated protein FliL